MGLSRYDPGEDVAGPVVLAAVVEPASRSSPGVQTEALSALPGPQLVVIGSSLSFTDAYLQKNPSNLYFLQNAINWMAGRSYLVGVPPKDAYANLIALSPGQMRACRWVFIGIVPACIIVLGMAVWQVRRR
jgi:hypothetical protein